MTPARMIARLGVFGAMVLAMAGCGSNPVIGVLLPTSGSARTYGVSMKKAIDLATEQAKAAGELPAGFQLVWADSGSDPDRAAQQYRKLVAENGAKLVIAGVTSGEARKLLPVIDETGVVCLTPSASAPDLTKESKYFYRLFASDDLEGRRAGKFLYEDQGKKSVLIYTGDSEHARGIEPPFRHMFEKAYDGKVVGKVVITEPGWEKESADLLAAHQPESVYIIAYADNTLKVLRHLRERKYTGTICVTSAFYSGELIEKDPALVEGIYFPQPAFDTKDENPLVQEFVDAYRAKYGHEPDIYAAHAYDAARIVMEVVRQTSVLEASEIKKTLQFGLEEFPGVTGIIQFNEYGDVHHNPIMFIIKDGEILNHERYVKEEKERIRKEIIRLLGKQ